MTDQNAQVITAPRFYMSSVQAFFASNDVALVLGHTTPSLKDGAFGDPVSQAVAVINMSPQSAKELMLLLKSGLEEIESQFGLLRTPFIDERTK